MDNASGEEPESEAVWISNNEAISEILAEYSPEIGRELRVRILDKSRSTRIRLFYAGILAIEGDSAGQEFLIREASRATSLAQAKNAFWVISCLDWFPRKKRIQVDMRWAEDFMVRMLQDKTELEPRPHDAARTRRSLAMDLGFGQILAKMKSKKLYPLLADICRTSPEYGIMQRDVIQALGELGDNRAVPLLLDVLKEHDTGICDSGGTYTAASYALAKMGAKEAIPILLKYLDDWKTYLALAQYRDDRVLPALKNAVSRLKEAAWYEAEHLIIELEGGDRLPRLIELWYAAAGWAPIDLLYEIADSKDERAIPFATDLLRNSASLDRRMAAASILGQLRSPEAIKPLIDALDMDLNALAQGIERKGDHNEMFREQLAHDLEKMTGKHFGVHKYLWLVWYALKYK